MSDGVRPPVRQAPSFALGAGVGVILTLLALTFAAPGTPFGAAPAGGASLGAWIDANLGHSVWPFTFVVTLYVMNLSRLNRLLQVSAAAEDAPGLVQVAELDQLLDVWIHLFIGIGVIWTAVGMRSALQAALGDPGAALNDTAGSVLRKLVDGGILLALTTTIVGGVGSYLMRLAKTLTVGARLNAFYDAHNRRDLRELVDLTRGLEQRLNDAPPAQQVRVVSREAGAP